MRRRSPAADRTARQRGQSLVELALVVPVLLLLLGGAIDLGRVFYSQIAITDAAREGALWAVQHPGSWTEGCDGEVITSENPDQVTCHAVGETTGGFATVTAGDVTCSSTDPAAPGGVVTRCAGAAPAPGASVWVTVRGTFTLAMGGATLPMSATAVGRIARAPTATALTAQTITFTTIPNKVLGVGSITVSASASSGLPVTFSTTTPTVCTAGGPLGSTIVIDAVGICSVTAFQDGDGSFAPAEPVAQSFNVTSPPPPPPGGQTITFGPLADRNLTQGEFDVAATASSGLPVTFTSTTTSICSSSGTNGVTIKPIAPGVCTVKADQVGDPSYDPAPSKSQSFTVTPAVVACVAPTALFRATPTSGFASKQGVPGTLFVFDGTTTTVQPACHPTWSWSFGDGNGTTSTPNQTSYTYPKGTQKGTYTVTLVVTVDGNLSSTVTHSVEIN